MKPGTLAFGAAVAATAMMLCVVSHVRAEAAGSARRPPNMILILADDMGFSDLGCYGGEIATPNIDALARGGVRFRQAYNAAVCVSTRTSLMTGLYPHQAGYQQRGGPILTQVPTIADLLRGAGYRTYISGKWHLGGGEAKNPRARGFDRFFGILDGASNYFKSTTIRPTAVYLDEMQMELSDDFYMTDAISDHAVTFLREGAAGGKPFLLYLAYTAPHFPLHAKPADIARYRGKYIQGWSAVRAARYRRQVELGLFDGTWKLTERPELGQETPWSEQKDKDDWDLKMAVYAAQVDSMDQGIGRVLGAVRELGVEGNTLVLFLSDNGAAASNMYETGPGKKAMGIPAGPAESYTSYGLHWANASNTPFTLYKTWTHEGGISTPLIASWPGRIARPGGLTDEVVHVMDIAATFLDAAGARYPAEFKGRTLPGLEGKSFLASLSGHSRGGERELAWALYGNKAIRRGDWKLVSRSPEHVTSSFKRWRYVPATHGDFWELFDLAADRTESRNLADRHPAIVRELATAYDAWSQRVNVPDKPVNDQGN